MQLNLIPLMLFIVSAVSVHVVSALPVSGDGVRSNYKMEPQKQFEKRDVPGSADANSAYNSGMAIFLATIEAMAQQAAQQAAAAAPGPQATPGAPATPGTPAVPEVPAAQ